MPQDFQVEQVGVFPPSPNQLRGTLTDQHIKSLFGWEDSVWKDRSRPFDNAVGQVAEELREAREVWTDVLGGDADLSEPGVIHHLREEIADGMIANLGFMRALIGNDERVIAAVKGALNQNDRSRAGFQSRVSLYFLRGQRVLDRVSDFGKNLSTLTPSQKNDLVLASGSALKSGFVALSALGADPAALIEAKVNSNLVKYSRERLAMHGNTRDAKSAWNARQLPVIDAAAMKPANSSPA